jgi:hypothetical protein
MKNIQSVSLAGPLLASMTREELRSVAKVLNVPRGRSGKNTRYNLSQAIANGQAHVKIMGYIYAPASKDSPAGSRGATIFIKKLITYKAIEHNYGFMP